MLDVGDLAGGCCIAWTLMVALGTEVHVNWVVIGEVERTGLGVGVTWRGGSRGGLDLWLRLKGGCWGHS